MFGGKLMHSQSDGVLRRNDGSASRPAPMLEVIAKETAIEPKKRRLQQWRGPLPPHLPPATPFKPSQVATLPRRSNAQGSVGLGWMSPPNMLGSSEGFLQRSQRSQTAERGQRPMNVGFRDEEDCLQRSTRAGSAPSVPSPERENVKPPPDQRASSRAVSCPSLNGLFFPGPAGQRFEQPKLIGLGSFGEVYRVYCPDERKHYAIKKLRRPFRSTTERARALYEVANHKILSAQHRKKRRRNTSPNHGFGAAAAMGSMDSMKAQVVLAEEIQGHPHCVQYFNHWEYGGHLFIQTEYCRRGALKEYLQSVRLDEMTLWKFLGDLCLGLYHIHSNGFAHLDLKPENIFITEDGYLKIGDFGTTTKREDLHLAEHEGDNAYLAPEMLDKSVGAVSHLTDIFSMGLILYEMAADVDLPSKSGPTWQRLRNNAIPGLLSSSGGPYPKFDDLLQSQGWLRGISDELSRGPPCGLADSTSVADSTSFESTSSEEMEGDSGENEWVVVGEASRATSQANSASNSFVIQRLPSPPHVSESVLGLGFPALSIENRGQEVCPLTTSASFTPGTDPVQRDRDSPARRALFQAAASFFHAAPSNSSLDYCPVLPAIDTSIADNTTPRSQVSPASTASNVSNFSYQSSASTKASSADSRSLTGSRGSLTESPSSSFSSLYSVPVFPPSPTAADFLNRTMMSPKGQKDGRQNYLRRAGAGPSLSSSRATAKGSFPAASCSMMLMGDQEELSDEGMDETTLSHVANALSSVSFELQTLIRQMLNRYPRKRPSAQELLRHPVLSRFVRHSRPHAVRKIESGPEISFEDADKENVAPPTFHGPLSTPCGSIERLGNKSRKDLSRAKAAHHRIKNALLDLGSTPVCSLSSPSASFVSPSSKQYHSMPSPHLSPVGLSTPLPVPPGGLRNPSWLEKGPKDISSRNTSSDYSLDRTKELEEEDVWTSVVTPQKEH
eukprot:g23719.t1